MYLVVSRRVRNSMGGKPLQRSLRELANPTVEVPRFEVTYGYNLLAVGPALGGG
jgi:hypothetical protein